MILYPNAPRLDLVEDFHGTPVADPYRWLEDDDSAATATWRAEQNALTRRVLDALPGRDAFRRRLPQLMVGYVGCPIPRGSRMFFPRRDVHQEHGVLYVIEADGAERVLVDPNAMSPDHTVTLDDWWPSPDGELLAYKISQGGDEESTLYVMEVETGDVVDGPIERTRAGGFAWLPDSSSFYYTRRLPPQQVPPGEADYHRRVWLHRLGHDPGSDDLVFGEGRDKIEFYFIDLSLDGRWLVILAAKGNARVVEAYVADLFSAGAFRPIVEGEAAYTTAWVAEDDGRLYVRTNLDAPNFRLAVADPADPGPERWTDLLPETDAVLTRAFPAGDAVVAMYESHATNKLTIHDRATGALMNEVALPARGTVMVLSTTADVATRRSFWFAYTDFVTPPHVYHCDVPTAKDTLHAAPPGRADLPDIETNQVFYRSKDGTSVPMFVLHRRGLDLDGRRPTILNGYGGWAISSRPGYRQAAVAWIERGGVYAVANIRGGLEYGEEWHRAGMRENKQNVFDDFIAAAEWLIDNGYTGAGHLGIHGGSNGGLLVGACLTQRPDLFASVVCSAPVLDMVRYDRMPSGEIAYGELGNPHVAEEFRYLFAYSPYHRVEPDIGYPAVLFTVFESDARVAPWHARKMCAALQHATTSDRPVLYRGEEDVGHAARSISRLIDLEADTLAFHASMLDLDV